MMRQRNVLWSLLTMVVVALLGFGVASCNTDDDDDGLGMSESLIRSYLEAGSGTWIVSEKGKDYTFSMIFQDGKTSGYYDSTSSYWMTPYSVKGDLVYIKDKDAESYHGDVLESGIRLTKLTARKIEFYKADDRSEKYTGTKQEDYKWSQY